VFIRPCISLFVFIVTTITLFLPARPAFAEVEKPSRLLYVAVPGVRNLLEYGGHGLLVFDIEQNHRFVKRIPTAGLDETSKPLNVKGICVSVPLKRIFLTTPRNMSAMDIVSEKVLWEKSYPGGCDRMSISPDGKIIYIPSFEADHWHVVSAESGEILETITPKSKAHNTVFGPDGKHVYLAGLGSPILSIADTDGHKVTATVGPFSSNVRPFTINGSQTLCFVNVNGLLGFEVGDIRSGRKLHRVEVNGFKTGPVKYHGCPSHGVGLTPDEKQLWVVDAHNQQLHVFDATTMPPKQVKSIPVRDQPGWVSFGIDGKYGYSSTGEVIEVATHKVLTHLTDEKGTAVQSEKMVEIQFSGNTPVRAGDQFGIGRVGAR
jgi:hypothetical protein